MPFSIRPYRRFPVQCFVTYDTGPFTGVGTVWNLSMTGWRLSGDLPLRPGEVCSLAVALPNRQSIFVSQAVVRWARGNEYGIETVTIQKHTWNRLEHYVKRLIQDSVEASAMMEAPWNALP